MKEMRFRILVLKLLCMILKAVVIDFQDKSAARELYSDAHSLMGAIADEMRE